MLMVADWILGEDGAILDIMDHHDMWFLTFVPNFSFLAWLEVCQETSVLEVILGGHWRFLTGDLEDGVILEIMDHHDMWFSTSVQNFSSLACLEVCQEPPPPWHHKLSWYVILDLCAKFQLSSMLRSVSGTTPPPPPPPPPQPPSSKSYFKDAESSWLET